ncbi:hypothetical protein KR093_004691 [Drosophila rubida]|uniref:M-phase-specific PLK1-interacting protein n=1 Tax=Drosophila rubida TaxID=30044 RepID=A0AAD4JZC2_9MUSC|nr:hypothetical protein KR093_004691 [Drosophila rubida]
MGTPRKNTNYLSPYSEHVGQYPSQTSDYRSQHTGGLQQPYGRQPENKQRGTPHFYRDTTPQQQQNPTSGFYEDRQSSPHFYQNKTPYQHRGRNFGHRGGGRRGFHQHQQRQFNSGKNTNADTFSQYFHSSMLEDPWHELMERYNAIHGSIIDEPPKTNDVDT